jgi:hypothetical protein
LGVGTVSSMTLTMARNVVAWSAVLATTSFVQSKWLIIFQ